jgi:leucyl-tRNA synthetase
VQGTGESGHEKELLQYVHKAVKKVSEDIENIKYNTAVSAMMQCVNGLYKVKEVDGYSSAGWQFALESIVELMAPFAPHASEELWRDLGHEDSVHVDHWPELDENYLVQDTIKLAVQVNGKVRAEIEVASDASKEDIEAEALIQENVIAHLQNNKPTKVIYVPGRLVSIVVK